MNQRGALIVRRIICLCLLSCAAASAVAQSSQTAPVSSTAAGPLTLTQVLEVAHRANPTLLSAAQHLSAVRAQEITAGLRQNPNAVLGTQMTTLDPGDPNGTEFYQFGVQRLFERGGKRDARLATARSTTALTGFQLDDQRRQIDLSIRQAFSRMLFAQKALGIARENLADYQKPLL